MKKPWVWPVSLVTVGVFVAVGWFLHASLGSSMENNKLSMDGTFTVGVPALATDPTSYRGELRVRGIVAQVHPKEHLFALADLRCRKNILVGDDTGCMTVPVRWKGPLPALYSDVMAEGEVETFQRKSIFVAAAVRYEGTYQPKARSHKIKQLTAARKPLRTEAQ